MLQVKTYVKTNENFMCNVCKNTLKIVSRTVRTKEKILLLYSVTRF